MGEPCCGQPPIFGKSPAPHLDAAIPWLNSTPSELASNLMNPSATLDPGGPSVCHFEQPQPQG